MLRRLSGRRGRGRGKSSSARGSRAVQHLDGLLPAQVPAATFAAAEEHVNDHTGDNTGADHGGNDECDQNALGPLDDPGHGGVHGEVCCWRLESWWLESWKLRERVCAWGEEAQRAA